METLRALAERSYHGNTLALWVEALALFLGLLAVLPLARLLLTRRLNAAPSHRSSTLTELLREMLRRTTGLFLFVVAMYFGLKLLELPPRIDRIADIVIQIALWLQVALWGIEAVGFVVDRRMSHVSGDHAPTLSILRFVGMLIIWAIATLMLLSNLGVNITTLVAGLGISGVAVALAVQNVLGDLLASLSIALDKPFVVGDLLRLDDLTGRVEYVGIKSTRLRSIDGEQIIISNAQLLAARLHNLGRMSEQRLVQLIGVAADTPLERLRTIPALLERIVKSLPGSRLDHCHLRGFGNGALEFELVFYVGADRAALFDAQQQFNLRLIERFGAENITLTTGGATRAPPPASAPPRIPVSVGEPRGA